MGFERLSVQGLVVVALSGLGHGTGRHHAGAHLGAAFTGVGLQQCVGGQGGHFHVQVNAVEQWPAEFALVACNLVWRAAAVLVAGPQVAARARVHGRDELKTCRKFGLLRGA